MVLSLRDRYTSFCREAELEVLPELFIKKKFPSARDPVLFTPSLSLMARYTHISLRKVGLRGPDCTLSQPCLSLPIKGKKFRLTAGDPVDRGSKTLQFPVTMLALPWLSDGLIPEQILQKRRTRTKLWPFSPYLAVHWEGTRSDQVYHLRTNNTEKTIIF